MAKKTKVALEKLQDKYKLQEYDKLYEYVMQLCQKGKLVPVKKSGSNGKTPALYNYYWRYEEENLLDEEELKEELLYELHPMLDNRYYLKYLSKYVKDRVFVKMLSDYITDGKEKLSQRISINERSFDIFFREKFIDKEQGKKILHRLGIDIEQLGIYETTEPLAYYCHSKVAPQNVLILENKDTFYSMRKYMQEKKQRILGMEIGTIIYGGGKAIVKSFEDFVMGAEPFFMCPDNQVYYFGDLDYEGIQIFETLYQRFEKKVKIRPFVNAYEKMFEKAKHFGLERMPDTKDGQGENAGDCFWKDFTAKDSERIKELLKQRKYIPQEILNCTDF